MGNYSKSTHHIGDREIMNESNFMSALDHSNADSKENPELQGKSEGNSGDQIEDMASLTSRKSKSQVRQKVVTY